MDNSTWMDRGSFEIEKDNEAHVNPGTLDGNILSYGMDSGQTIADVAFQTKDYKSKTIASPTNIVPNEKVDRKTLKRMRNRVSASRCRVRKKEWIHELEDESNSLSNENKMLLQRIASLEESITALRHVD
jgi:hypothetical protein